MKKAILILFATGVQLLAMAQSGIFQTVLTQPFDNRINDIAPHPQGWVAAGWYQHCLSPFLVRMDNNGNVAWQANTPYHIGDGVYNTILETPNGYLVSGNVYVADDYDSEMAYGFVDYLNWQDSVVNVLRDTAFKTGFDKITANDSLIVVSGTKPHPFNLQYPLNDYAVCYNTNGDKLWEYHFPNRHILGLHIIDTLVWVVTDSTTYQLNLQGQVLPVSFQWPAVASYTRFDSLVAVVTTDFESVLLDRYGNTSPGNALTGMPYVFVDIYQTSSNKAFSMFEDTINDVFILNQIGSPPMLWQQLPRQCTSPLAFGVKDSLMYAVAGIQQTDRIHTSSISTVDFNGNRYTGSDSVTITDAGLYVGSYWDLELFLNGHGRVIYDGQLSVTFRNDGNIPLESVLIHSEMLDQFNCAMNFAHKQFDNLNLAPGQSETVRFNLNYINASITNYTIEYNIYAVGPNQKLMRSCPTPLKSNPYIFVGIDNLLAKDNIRVYPNPATRIVTLQNLPKDATLGIYTLQGQRVLATAPNETTVNVEALPSGFYLYLILDGEGQTLSTGKLAID